MKLRHVGITRVGAAPPRGSGFHTPCCSRSMNLSGHLRRVQPNCEPRPSLAAPKLEHAAQYQIIPCNRSHMGGLLGEGQRHPLREGGGEEGRGGREDESFILAVMHAQRDMCGVMVHVRGDGSRSGTLTLSRGWVWDLAVKTLLAVHRCAWCDHPHTLI